MTPDFEKMARELLIVRLDDKPEGITVREAMYFQFRDALRDTWNDAIEAAKRLSLQNDRYRQCTSSDEYDALKVTKP